MRKTLFSLLLLAMTAVAAHAQRTITVAKDGTGDYAKMVFAATGNVSTNGLYIGGPMRVVFETEFAFDKNSAGQATPIGLMQVPTTVNNDYVRAAVVDLNGKTPGKIVIAVFNYAVSRPGHAAASFRNKYTEKGCF